MPNTTFEWYLYKEDYLREAGKLKQLPDEKMVTVSATEPGEYRLYAYMHDYLGNVVTASMPFTVSTGKKSAPAPAVLSSLQTGKVTRTP
jgi:hypothetical protein